MTETPPPAPPSSGLESKVKAGVDIVKGLSFTNILIMALLLALAAPTYILYRALNDDKLMDRFMSTYEEIADDQQTGCSIRHVQRRGGPDIWSVSSGFSFVGNDRWMVSVVLDRQPNDERAVSYCESLKLIADKMLSRGNNSGAAHAPAVEQ